MKLICEGKFTKNKQKLQRLSSSAPLPPPLLGEDRYVGQFPTAQILCLPLSANEGTKCAVDSRVKL